MREAAAQHRIGDQPRSPELEEDGCVAHPGEPLGSRGLAGLRRGESGNHGSTMSSLPPSRRHAVLLLAYATLTALICAGLVGAAALVPAPAAVLPLVIVVAIGLPMVAACELPAALTALRAEGALGQLRRALDRLPETEHPLGL